MKSDLGLVPPQLAVFSRLNIDGISCSQTADMKGHFVRIPSEVKDRVQLCSNLSAFKVNGFRESG